VGSDDHSPPHVARQALLVAPSPPAADISEIYFSRTIQFNLLCILCLDFKDSDPCSFGNCRHIKFSHYLDLRVDA